MKKITQEQLEALNSLSIIDPQGALELLEEYDEEYLGDVKLWLNSGGILIDIGGDLLKADLVLEGINRLELAIEKRRIDNPTIFYNLANGYTTLHNLYRQIDEEKEKLDPDNTPLLKAKQYYRKALKKIDQLNIDLGAQLLVNYGNCLTGLGRSVEALSSYDQALKYVPDHPMAKGNLAVELNYFARITRHSIFILDAYEMLEEVLTGKNLDSYLTAGTIQSFTKHKDNIANNIALLGLDKLKKAEHEALDLSPGFPRDYVEFCAKHQLLLNLCHSCRRCNRYFEDNVTFSLITGLDNKTTYTRLSRVVNEIKEQFAFARLLMFQSLYPIIDTLPIDDLTGYVDNLDYAVYGSRVASMKLAYQCAFNVLDKVAHFLNDYLEIGLEDDRNITFTTNGRIWREKKNNPLRQELKNRCNPHLLGLYDIARDLDTDFENPNNEGYWGYLRRTRNALTHEYLILHVERMHWAAEADKDSLHMFYSEFVDQSLDLFKLVRSVVICLISFIDLEERKKHKKLDGLVAPMFAPRYNATLFSSSLDGKIID